ncbi:hypothetical protein LCGC14_0503930 [marine sediment metagenome]|uniref:Uncharacterized protein n=1 Tax=marine sediment metagenome TaxID=412755 RepID=A0A0F9VBK5_9ZZZZ
MGNSESIACERVVDGRGDMIMLRAGLVASIEKRPYCVHYLYCQRDLIPMVSDIDRLTTVAVPGRTVSQRHAVAKEMIESYGHDTYVNLNNCCLEHEVKYQPNVSLSRQELFCRALDVEFDPNNYKVKFSSEEMAFGMSFLSKLNLPIIGLHIKPAMIWRVYPYMDWLIKVISRDIKGTLVTVDSNFQYKGRRNNVVSLLEPDIRKVWATMSLMNVGLGIDSFGCHAWGSTGVDIYGIFGSTDPEIFLQYSVKTAWAPLTKLCPIKQRCWYKQCGSPNDHDPLKPPKCLSVLWPTTIWKDAVAKLDLYDYIKKPKQIEKIKLHTDKAFVQRVNSIQITPKHSDSIAILLLEGLGGTTAASDYAKKVYGFSKRKSYLFVRKHEDLFLDNPYVDGIECVGDGDYGDYLSSITPLFEATIVAKTGLGRWIHTNGFKPPIIPNTILKSAFDDLPNNTKDLEGYGKNFIQVTNYSLGFFSNKIENYVYYMGEYDGLPRNFIVVSNGVDIDHRGVSQTKSWPLEYWHQLHQYIDFPLVQVGTEYDKKIHGVIDLRSKTTIPQLLYILSRSVAIVCQEGGLMHLGHAVSHRNVFVMRGPTAGNFYRYPGHYCIDSTVCKTCYWDTPNWWFKCPKNMGAVCMKSILPEDVGRIAMNELRRTGGYK